MRKTKIFRILILSNIVLSIFFLALSQNVNISRAQVYNNQNKTLTVPQNFHLVEFAENITTKKNITSIDIEPPIVNWNITDIEMNFTNIKLERETKIIENQDTGTTRFIYRTKDTPLGNPDRKIGLAVQLNISESTTIFGLYLYCRKTLEANVPILFQVRGFNTETKTPTNTPYYINMTLNVSTDPKWYYQNFTSPLYLSKGNYSLVMNGSKLQVDSSFTKKYFWYYIDPQYTPKTPNLYISEYKTTTWSNVVVNSTFLYKLVQKVNRAYYPQTINMTVKVDNKGYTVRDGKAKGSGNVTIPNLNLNTIGQPLHVPIYNNNSIQLNFSLSYKLKLRHYLFSNASVLISNSSIHNNWTITPIITRYYSNHSVRFNYLKNWVNITVYKNKVNITQPQNVTVDETNHFIIIHNSSISNNANWSITAKSPNFNITIITPIKKFDAGQWLTFSVNTTGMNGNLTYILLDSKVEKKYEEMKVINSNSMVFSYLIPTVSNFGNWSASIYWYNTTDAGYKQQMFQVTSLSGGSSSGRSGGGGGGGGGTTTIISPPTEGIIIDPLFLVFIAVIGSISSTAAGTSYMTIKKVHGIREAKKQKLLDRSIDVLNLNYIIIMDKGSGLSIYEQFLAGKQIEGTLISGFLQAIRIFGIELTGAKEESQTIKLEYQDSKILMSDFKNFRLLLIMKNLPSQDFLESVKALSHEIEEKFSNLLGDFKGDVRPFSDIKTIIEEHLNTPFIYPLKVDTAKIIKTNKTEKSLINRAINLMKANEMDHFYMLYLMGEKMFTPKDIKTVFSLIDKKIFYPKT